MSVVIVNYNTREDLRACLSTIPVGEVDQVVVADNCSTDGSSDMVRVAFPQANLYSLTSNLGYGAAANKAIATCASPYVLLLNSDTRLQPGALCALSTYLDLHPRAAVVGPRLSNPDGTLQASCFPFPTPIHYLFREVALSDLVRHVPILKGWYLPAWSYDRPREVPWVLGAALAIRRNPFEEVGGFDESYFMYSEEVDLCYRLHTAHWQVHFAPVTEVVHIGGASTRHYRSDMVVQLYASLWQFYRQHYTPFQAIQLKIVIAYIMLRNLIRDTVRLRHTADPLERKLLAEDLRAWRRVAANLGHSHAS